VRLLLKRGGVSGGKARVMSTTVTGEWSDDRSRQDVAAAEFGGIPSVTQKSKRPGSLCLSEGLYVGSPVERWLRCRCSIVL
jgi:hypothetical protein